MDCYKDLSPSQEALFAIGNVRRDRTIVAFGLVGVGQSTFIRVATMVPVTSAMGVPTPTAAKLEGQTLKSKVPL